MLSLAVLVFVQHAPYLTTFHRVDESSHFGRFHKLKTWTDAREHRRRIAPCAWGLSYHISESRASNDRDVRHWSDGLFFSEDVCPQQRQHHHLCLSPPESMKWRPGPLYPAHRPLLRKQRQKPVDNHKVEKLHLTLTRFRKLTYSTHKDRHRISPCRIQYSSDTSVCLSSPNSVRRYPSR